MPTVRRSILYSFFESYLGIAINIVSFMVLARLLTPKEVGVYSVSLAILSIAQVVRDFGLVSFLIQKEKLTEEHIATAWGMALLLGGTLFLIVQLGAPYVGAFYRDASVAGIARIIGINFLILPFNSVCLALLRRDMHFQKVMRINLTSALLSTCATLLLAWLGCGAYSLAFGAVINNALVAIGVWQTGASLVLLHPRLQHWREVLRFGGPLTAANIITSISMDINDLAVGKIMGFDAVAIASRAQGLMNLFNKDFMNAIRNVAYPAYSNVFRNGEALEEKFVLSVTNLCAIAWTFYGFAALFPLEVLRLMFGPQWDHSAPLVPLFCLAGAASAVANLVQTLILATGHARQVAVAELVIQPIKAVALCLVVYIYRDLWHFAVAFLVIAVLAVPYFYAFKQRYLPTDFSGLARGLGKNLLLTGLSLAPALSVVTLLRLPDQALPLSWFFFCAMATCLSWLAGLWVLKHHLHDELMLVIRKFFPVNP